MYVMIFGQEQTARFIAHTSTVMPSVLAVQELERTIVIAEYLMHLKLMDSEYVIWTGNKMTVHNIWEFVMDCVWDVVALHRITALHVLQMHMLIQY